jgi:hypothetical protein
MNVMKAFYYMQDRFPAFRQMTDSIQIGVHSVRQYFCSYYIEPPYDYLSIICVSNSDYHEILKKICCDEDPLSYYHRVVENMPQYDCHVSMRFGGLFLSRFIKEGRCDFNLSKTRTPTHFLSIEYSHPALADNVTIELNASIYIEGNEILTKQFVRRYLEYQSEPFIFDDNYKLTIMDSKIKIFELTSNQYVTIGKSGYEIITIG